MFWRVDGHSQEFVVLFFILSGYVIAFVSSRNEDTARSYFVARAARIYSVAPLAILVTLAAGMIGTKFEPSLYFGHTYFNPHTGIADVLSYLTFTNEIWWRHAVVGTDEPYWSLGFEVWYYVIFGVALFLPRRSSAVAIPVLLLMVGPKIGLYFVIWLVGCGTFHMVRRLSAQPRRGLGWVLFLSCPAAYFTIHGEPAAIFGSSNFGPVLVESWLYYLTVAILFAGHILGFSMIASRSTAAVGRLEAAIRWVAGATFTLYLTHQPILICLAALSPWPAGSVAQVAFVLLGTMGTVFALAEIGERRKGAWRFAIERLVQVSGLAAQGRS